MKASELIKENTKVKAMDELAKSGELEGKDVEAAILSVNPEDNKEEQVKQFESALSAQK